VAIAMALAPLLLGWIGWQSLWVALGAMALLLVPVTVAATRGLAEPAGPRLGRAELGAVAGRPGPWLLGLAFGTYSLQWFALVTWLPTFMIETLGFGGREAGLLTALVVLANVGGNLLGGVLMSRGAERWALILTAQATMGLATLTMQLAPIPDPARYAAALAFSFVGGMLPASVLSGAPRHAGDPRLIGMVNGIIVQGANLGTVSGPPLLALLVAALGSWRVASPLLVGAAVIGIASALLLRRVERR
jgi:cyanate permease